MAASLGRICRSGLLKQSSGPCFRQTSNISTTKEWSKGQKKLLTCIGVAAGGIGALLFTLDRSVNAEELMCHPPKYPWHWLWWRTLDHQSMRRGWEVYKNVCSACHSLQSVTYRDLIGVTHTEEEAKALAEEVEVKDGPNDVGEYYMRPGKLADHIPSPYPNEEAARAANNGAYPPDLSLIMRARYHYPFVDLDYVFSLLTGYHEAPAGVEVREGQYYNPYFPGGFIGMGQVVYDGVLEFEDGTPATASQIAKDVSSFLRWTMDYQYDERAILFFKTLVMGGTIVALMMVWSAHKWSVVKNTKVLFLPKKK